MKLADRYNLIHDEGFILLKYNEEFDLYVLITYYDTGSFNDTEIQLYRYWSDAIEVYKKNLRQIEGDN
jgi:hypothetical protein